MGLRVLGALVGLRVLGRLEGEEGQMGVREGLGEEEKPMKGTAVVGDGVGSGVGLSVGSSVDRGVGAADGFAETA